MKSNYRLQALKCVILGPKAAPLPAVKRVPIGKPVGIGFLDTLEGCAIYGDGSMCSRDCQRAAKWAFNLLDEETKRYFLHCPKPGEYIERARFFADLMRPVLSPQDYHNAVISVLIGYRYCLTRQISRQDPV